MARAKPKTRRKSTVVDRFKRDPMTTTVNEAKKAGVPKPATKLIIGLTALGLLATPQTRSKVRKLPFGDWLEIPMNFGVKLKHMVKK